MPQDPEAIPLEALRAGDRESFARLVEAYSPRIYRLALSMLDDEQEAEDVLQETFLNAYRALPDFEGRSSLGTWLHRIAANQALMRLRRPRPHTVPVEDDDPEGPPQGVPRELYDWCCLPEPELMNDEVRGQMRASLRELSPALRAVFVLRDLQGFDTQETARLLGLSEAAVKTRLSRARLKLRASLSAYFAERAREVPDARPSLR